MEMADEVAAGAGTAWTQEVTASAHAGAMREPGSSTGVSQQAEKSMVPVSFCPHRTTGAEVVLSLLSETTSGGRGWAALCSQDLGLTSGAHPAPRGILVGTATCEQARLQQ